MPTFQYKARDRGGRSQQGFLEAASSSALANDLRNRGWLVLEVRASANAGEDEGLAVKLNPFNWMPPRSLDVELGFEQLAVMLRSGLTLLTALSTIAEQTPRYQMRKVWRRISERIQEGTTFADALAEHKCFPHLAIHLVRVGEQTGNLDVVVVRASDVMEHRRNLITSTMTALAYPALVTIAAIGVSVFLVVNVIPKLGTFLSSLGRQLPPMTQNLVNLANFVQVYGIQIVIGLIAFIVATIGIYLWPPGRLWMDTTMLRIPVIGRVFRLSNTALFARGLGILIRSGITLLEGLRTAENLHRNRYLSRQVAAARDAVMRGSSLAAALKFPHGFMPMLSNMVAVGEASGTLDDALDEVAKFHESQMEKTIRRLSVLIEPAIIVVVGGIVGYVYIAFFVALFAAAGSR